MNAFTGAGYVRAGPADHVADGLAGQVRVLLGAGEGELLADDALVEHEPGVAVTRSHDVFEGAERVETGEERDRQPLAARVQPEGRGAGRIRMPCLAQIGFQFSMPSVQCHIRSRLMWCAPASLGDAQHQAVDVAGTPESIFSGGSAEPLGPLGADQVVVAADTAGGDDHRLGLQLEGGRDLTAARGAALRPARLQDLAGDRVERPGRAGQAGDPVAEPQPDEPLGDALADAALEATTPGPVPQVMWKRGTELPWPLAS